MRIGAIFPQTEIGADSLAVRDFAQAAESLGYDHLATYEHVLGANADSRSGWSGAYRHTDLFHEPFVLFGYLAGLTSRIELATGVLVLPLRQTVLVAKQAAEVDVLSNGRLRVGIGVGWNAVEFEAMGRSFRNRGARIEEQIHVLRGLWTNRLLTYEGRWHRITDAGLNPLPVQRPIPIWMGGSADPVVRRIARYADGWILPGGRHEMDSDYRLMLDQLRHYCHKHKRDRAEIGIEKVVTGKGLDTVELANNVAAWKRAGATHLTVNTMGQGMSSPADHIDAIRQFKNLCDSV